MEKYRLSAEETRQTGYTHRYRLTFLDLASMLTVNTALAINLRAVTAGAVISGVATRLVTPFQATGDAAFNTTAITLGDGGSANRYLASQELNANGAFVVAKAAGTPYAHVGAENVKITFNAMAAKALASLNAGVLEVYLAVGQLDTLRQ